LGLLKQVEKNRKVRATGNNPTSSRGHLVCMLRAYRPSPARNDIAPTLFLVDLAGSERYADAKGEVVIEQETKSINHGRTALHTAIISYRDKSRYIPTSNSELTTLLSQCFVSPYKILIISHISPVASDYGYNFATLEFASKIRAPTNAPKPPVKR